MVGGTHYTARYKEGPSEKSGAVVEGFPLAALPFILCTQESQELGHMCMNSMGIYSTWEGGRGARTPPP